MAIAVRVRDVSKRFRIYHRRNLTLKQALLQRQRGVYEEFLALKDVSFEIEHGGALGIIGENGSGKSTLLKCIAGILDPDAGSIETHGRVAALLELGAGFHPEYTGRENVYLNGALLGLPRRYIDHVIDEIIEFSELERFIDNPVRTYSSGMYARLGFSIAVHLDPDILVIDEILAVGDEAFQRRCYDRIARMRAEGRTLVMVSHALEPIQEFCTDCIWLDHGRIRERGAAPAVIARYLAEVSARESALMASEVERVHQLVPSGRGGVGVTRVRFEGADGPTHVFETGEPFAMVIEYHAPSTLEGARFSVGFLLDHDRRCRRRKLEPATGRRGQVVHPEPSAPGRPVSGKRHHQRHQDRRALHDPGGSVPLPGPQPPASRARGLAARPSLGAAYDRPSA